LENLLLQLLVSSGDGKERRRIKKAYLDAPYAEA
jgi:hypothetical protein